MDTQVGDPLLGSLVDGRYHVRERVARDGMATTYVAVDERLRRTVTLKVLQPEHPGQPFHLGRFADEVTGLARLTHPNATVWYGQGMHDGLPYLVLEHVRGRTLREVLAQRGRLAPLEALAVAEQLLSALAAAHRTGLVHRDVRPENILVAEPPGGGHDLLDAVIKVADLGLVRAIEAGGGQPAVTAAYVSPEQVAEGRSDQRGDVYSAGIVLFEMLTGRVPYEGPRPAEVAWQHVQQDVPPPSRLVPGLPPVLDDLVASATRRNPGARFMDAGALLQAVQAARETITVSAARMGPPPQHTQAFAAQPLAQETMIVDQVVPAARPSWARLPGAEQERADTRTRRQAAATGGVGALLDQARGHYERLMADPRGRRALIAGAAVLTLLVLVSGWWLFSGRYESTPQVMNLPKDQAVTALRAAGLEVAFAEPQYRAEVPKDVVLLQDPLPGEDIAGGGTVTLTLSLGPESRQVPDVTGKTWDLAVADLAAEPLRLKAVKAGSRYDDLIPKDTVLETDPKAGTEVEPGTQVKVILSKGRAPLTVPFVEGKPLHEARSELERMGLRVSVEYVDSDKPYEIVVKQDPANGTGVERNATVKLQVSKNQSLPSGTAMPELRGWNCGDAENHLTAMGLRVELRGIRGGDKNAYRVERQYPAPNTPLQPNQRVILRCEQRR
ncbi:PASTA domain-containing protein [Catellatospora sp. NPDC049609]|uniref:PASTA domain-containing protein n=1 Tax=Catellatospora sp. NPDC049609 TaxID=3155505 RepID=UPI0034242EB9